MRRRILMFTIAATILLGAIALSHLARGPSAAQRPAGHLTTADYERLMNQLVNHAYGAVVLGMDTSNVDSVLIGGKVKKWRGELVGVRMDRLRCEVDASREYLLARAGWPRTVLGGYLPGH